MKKKKRNKKKEEIKKLLIQKAFFLSVFLIIVFALFVLLFIYLNFFYAKKIYPKVKIAGVDIGSKSKEEAKRILEKESEKYLKKSITLKSEKRTWTFSPYELGVSFDIGGSVDKAYLLGNKGNPISDFYSQIKTFFVGENIPIEVDYNQEDMFDKLNNIADEVNTKPTNAKFKVEGYEVDVEEEEVGKRLWFTESKEGIIEAAKNLNGEAEIEIRDFHPQFTKNDLEGLKSEIKEKISLPISLNYSGKEWEIDSDKLLSWIDIKTDYSTSLVRLILNVTDYPEAFLDTAFKNKTPELSLNKEEVKRYISDLSETINIEVKNAQLGVRDGKVVVIKNSQAGQVLDIEESCLRILTAFEKEKDRSVDLPVSVIQAEVREDNLDELGITERISQGKSNFTGSPENRIHNIKVGASKFNGVLIKPDETFSFNTTLGPVDASTGYLPELVILRNKTVPQYGGGMCQVSTTCFRSALNSGLPILARTPHAYPVVYYYPLGTDATVYLPSPDLKFKNDTENYILIQTYTSGYYLYYDFYGTKPNRVVKFSGYENGEKAVDRVENVSPNVYNRDIRGSGSLDALVFRFIYDAGGKLIRNDRFLSKYDSPTKYPH